MEFTAAVQKLGAYHARPSPKSKETLKLGLPKLRSGVLAAQGETGTYSVQFLAGFLLTL